jgi:hypothetical protein
MPPNRELALISYSEVARLQECRGRGRRELTLSAEPEVYSVRSPCDAEPSGGPHMTQHTQQPRRASTVSRSVLADAELLTVGQAAKFLKIRPTTLKRWLAQGLPTVRLGPGSVRR